MKKKIKTVGENIYTVTQSIDCTRCSTQRIFIVSVCDERYEIVHRFDSVLQAVVSVDLCTDGSQWLSFDNN